MIKDIYLKVNGELYQGFTDIYYSKSIEDLCGTFSFSMSTSKDRRVPFKVNDECQVIVKNVPLLTGYIEAMNGSHSIDNHSISVSGRDRTCDIIDSTIQGNIDFKTPIKLVDLIGNVLAEGNLGFINVFNLSGRKLIIEEVASNKKKPKVSAEFLKKLAELDRQKDKKEKDIALEKKAAGIIDDPILPLNESVSAKVGENMFEFIEKYCRKKGVLITTDGYGDIVIIRAGMKYLDGVLLNEINGKKNNIISANISYDNSERFYRYICKSQGNPSVSALTEDDGAGLVEMESTIGEAIDSEIRNTRYLEFANETSSESTTNKDRAKWEANIRRARSKVYRCTTNRMFVDGEENVLYAPNIALYVKDDFWNIDSILLIKSVDFSVSIENGIQVTLVLVARDAYTLEPSPEHNEELYNKFGKDMTKIVAETPAKAIIERIIGLTK